MQRFLSAALRVASADVSRFLLLLLFPVLVRGRAQGDFGGAGDTSPGTIDTPVCGFLLHRWPCVGSKEEDNSW